MSLPHIPRFSIIIPMYNVSGYVGRTLESVLSQSFGDFEVIIVDDGSTDGSPECVEEINDPRVRLFKQENGGVSSARNKAMSEATGKYLAFLDADDYWYPDHLELASYFFEEFPSCGLYTGRYGPGNWNREIPTRPEGGKPATVMNYFYAGFREIHTSVFVVRRDLAVSAGNFEEHLRFGEDVLYWYKVANCSPFMGVANRITGLYMAREDSAVHSDGHANYDIAPLSNAFDEAAKLTPPQEHKNVALRYFQLQWFGKALLHFPRKKMQRLLKRDKKNYDWATKLGLQILLLNLSLWRIAGRFILKRAKKFYAFRGRRWSRLSVREAGFGKA